MDRTAAFADATPLSFWLDDPGAPEPAAPLVGSARADLVIVGGGYTGLWAALLAKADDPSRDVVVLEGDRCGWAASGRNGGFCAASLTHGLANGVERFPDEVGLLERLGRGLAEAEEACAWLWDAASVRTRFEHVGKVSARQASDYGLVGPAARACGLVRDVRFDHPAGWHRFAQAPVAVWPGGDVFARARVRWLELQRSGRFLTDELANAPDGGLFADPAPSAPDTLAAALVEGWRGEVCHVALTDREGRFRRYKITDPSFHNWTGLELALRGQAISDFPLCNKSFNLSYCGFDL